MNTGLAIDLLNTFLPLPKEMENIVHSEQGRLHEDAAAFLLYREGKYVEALDQLGQDLAATGDPDRKLALTLVEGNCYLKLGRNEEALATYFRIWAGRHELKSRDPLSIQFNMSICARRMGNHLQAASHLQYIIDNCPQDNTQLAGLAWREMAAVWRPHDEKKAMECSRNSLRVLSPEDGGILQKVEELGLAFSTGNDEGFLELLANLDMSEMTDAQQARCHVYEQIVLSRSSRHKDLVERFQQLEEQLKTEEHAVDHYATAGLSCLELGRMKLGRRYLDRAWQLYSQSGKIHNRELLKAMDKHLRMSSLESLPFDQLEEFGILGISPPVLRLKNQLRQINSGNLPVLITGESGSGKELVARSFVQDGRPFVPVNCRAVSTSLISSLLFGHAKGAFTGASQESGGWVQEAEGGVLFLDEVGDLPLEVQPLLFRFLDDGSYYRVGEHVERHAQVRIVAATNLDVQDRNQMRMELTNRLAGFLVEMPPLRERGDDLLYLAAWFVKRFNKETGSRKTLGPDPGPVLARWHYPGNIRELRFLLQRACTISNSDFVLPAFERELERARSKQNRAGQEGGFNIPVEQLGSRNKAASVEELVQAMPIDPGFSLLHERKCFEEGLRRRALELCDGNIRAAARLLGESPTGIQRLLQKDKNPERGC